MDVNEGIKKVQEAGATINRLQDTAKAKLSDMSDRLMERSKAAASSTDQYVREYAWSSVALAALLGVVVGLVIRRS
jgi:ElaB/YqjD/DUF883 family membrane-anchored ribosome-binding protein